MREIKFRAWDVENKKMIQSYAHLSKWGQFYTTWTSTDSEREYIPMQYTGLQDKDGVNIFEGDILKSHGIVAWNDLEHCWSVIDLNWNDKREWHNIDYLSLPFEVIGNIYETPELLDK